MKVIVDAGNTNVKLAYVDRDGIITRLTLEQLLKAKNNITSLVYCSVNNSLELKQVLDFCVFYNIPFEEVKVTKTFKEIQCGYNVVENLGVDRWMAIIGARTTYKEKSLIIVDAGTAVTLDICIDNMHLGGWITPGLELMQKSITDKAPGVFMNNAITQECFGTNTPSALYHGTLYALVGLIEQAKKIIKEKNEISIEVEEPNVVITGGNAKLLVKHLVGNITLNEDLVFHGLKQVPSFLSAN